jgi:hypothetical protein
LLAQEGHGERAAELAALALHHPRSHVEVTKRARGLLDELETVLPPDLCAAAQVRGKARDLDAAMKDLLAGLDD